MRHSELLDWIGQRLGLVWLDAPAGAAPPGADALPAQAMTYPDAASLAALAQGVTLEVIGQDGLSYAPVDDRTLEEVRRAITGWNGYGEDIDFTWRSVGGYLDRLDHGFDGEGIAGTVMKIVDQGRLTTWLLDLRSARQLGLTGGDALTLQDERPILVAKLRERFEGWLPAYMAGRSA